MFIGHFAVALAGKKLAPKTSLGTSILAAQWLDLIWPLLLLTGVEKVAIEPSSNPFTHLRFESYPISHSLVMATVWAFAVGFAYWTFKRYRAGAVWLGVAVFSHWYLDFLTHNPDLPLLPGGEAKVGMGLWNQPWVTVGVEGALFAGATLIYLRNTRAKNKAGTWGLVGLLAFLLVSYAGSLLGPPPPSTHALAFTALTMWLLPLWGAWVDRNRRFGDSGASS